jgi:hypothetical protein
VAESVIHSVVDIFFPLVPACVRVQRSRELENAVTTRIPTAMCTNYDPVRWKQLS